MLSESDVRHFKRSGLLPHSRAIAASDLRKTLAPFRHMSSDAALFQPSATLLELRNALLAPGALHAAVIADPAARGFDWVAEELERQGVLRTCGAMTAATRLPRAAWARPGEPTCPFGSTSADAAATATTGERPVATFSASIVNIAQMPVLSAGAAGAAAVTAAPPQPSRDA